MTTIRVVALSLLVAGGMALHQAPAQTPGIARIELVRHDLAVSGHEAIQVRVEFAPGARFGNHVHPGDEIAYVLKGSLQYRFDRGQRITLRAGETLFIPAGTVHSALNVGTGDAAELATYIVEKGKPLVVGVD